MQYQAFYTDGTTDSGIIDPVGLAEHKVRCIAAILDPACSMYRAVITDPACTGTWDSDDILGITPKDRGETPDGLTPSAREYAAPTPAESADLFRPSDKAAHDAISRCKIDGCQFCEQLAADLKNEPFTDAESVAAFRIPWEPVGAPGWPKGSLPTEVRESDYRATRTDCPTCPNGGCMDCLPFGDAESVAAFRIPWDAVIGPDAADERLTEEARLASTYAAIHRQGEASDTLARLSREARRAIDSLDEDDDAAAWHLLDTAWRFLAGAAATLGYPLDPAGVPLPEPKDEA